MVLQGVSSRAVNLQMKLSNEAHVYHVRYSDIFKDLLRVTTKWSCMLKLEGMSALNSLIQI